MNECIIKIKEQSPVQFIDSDECKRQLYFIYRLAREQKESFIHLVELQVAINFLKRTLSSVIESIKENVDYLLHISTFSLNRNNILQLYLKTDFKNVDPLTLSDYSQFYKDSIKTFITQYFNRNLGTNAVESIELSRVNGFSSRYNIYSRSMRASQIQTICASSDKLRQIYNNLRYLSDNLTTNELQKLYSSIVQEDMTDDLKLLVLKFNTDSEQLSRMRLQMPLIYKLIRAARIKSQNTNFTHYEKLLIRDVIKENIHSKLSHFLSSSHSVIISEAIAIKIESTITEGEFVDPYSLVPIQIKGSLFIEQLINYVQFISSHIKES